MLIRITGPRGRKKLSEKVTLLCVDELFELMEDRPRDSRCLSCGFQQVMRPEALLTYRTIVFRTCVCNGTIDHTISA